MIQEMSTGEALIIGILGVLAALDLIRTGLAWRQKVLERRLAQIKETSERLRREALRREAESPRIFHEDAPSEAVERAFSAHIATSCQARCEACGRTHFVDTEFAGDWDEGELEDLQARATADPDRCVAITAYDSIELGRLADEQLVLGCPCNRLTAIERFLWGHRAQIVEYLHRRLGDETETARAALEELEQLAGESWGLFVHAPTDLDAIEEVRQLHSLATWGDEGFQLAVLRELVNRRGLRMVDADDRSALALPRGEHTTCADCRHLRVDDFGRVDCRKDHWRSSAGKDASLLRIALKCADFETEAAE